MSTTPLEINLDQSVRMDLRSVKVGEGFSFKLENFSDEAMDAPLDWPGDYELRIKKQGFNNTSKLLTVGNGISITGNEMLIDVDSSDNNLQAGLYEYNLKDITDDENKFSLFNGFLNVER
jgi:hypothetical protein